MLFRKIPRNNPLAQARRYIAVMVCLTATLTSIGVRAQSGAIDYAWVHKTLVNLETPPWRCVCYSVSRESVIDTHQAENQVWVVARYNSWASAVAQRDMLAIGSDVCSFCPAVSGASLQGVFFVFENCASGRCDIGVADSNYSQPGWVRISQAFDDDREAWRYACRLHNKKNRFSPDIAERKIDCGNLSGGGGSRAPGLSGYRKIAGALINGHGIGQAERGHTASSCASRCNSEPRCKSFEVTGDWCSINVIDTRESPNALTHTAKYDYYERR